MVDQQRWKGKMREYMEEDHIMWGKGAFKCCRVGIEGCGGYSVVTTRVTGCGVKSQDIDFLPTKYLNKKF